MAAETIYDATWDDVREGDLATVERGIPHSDGYLSMVNRVESREGGRLVAGKVAVEVLRGSGYRVGKIVREVPDTPPLPVHAGALVFTDRGMERSDGDTSYQWSLAGENMHHSTSGLPNPVEALPVPAKELRSLAEALQGDMFEANAAAIELLDATRREWRRAGIDGGLYE